MCHVLETRDVESETESELWLCRREVVGKAWKEGAEWWGRTSLDEAIEKATGLAHGGRHVELSKKEERGRNRAEEAVEAMETGAGKEEIEAEVERAWREGYMEEKREHTEEQDKEAPTPQGGGETEEREKGAEEGRAKEGQKRGKATKLAGVILADIAPGPACTDGGDGRRTTTVAMIREILVAGDARSRGIATGALRTLLKAQPKVREVHTLIREGAGQQKELREWLGC